MIESLSLSKFTVFDDLQIGFGPKVNILIGENGTGKTHLLKAAYAMCSANSRHVDPRATTPNEVIEFQVTQSLLQLFLPLDDKLGKLRTYGVGSDGNAELAAHFVPAGRRLHVRFHSNSQTVAIRENVEYGRYSWKSVFIPTKEVLSFMKGFASLYERYELSFDQTYQDICLALDLPALRAENLPPKSKWAMDEIRAICQGRFLFHGGGKVTFRNESGEYSANAMAEGFRKVGTLSRLLETGVIQPGVSGPLFWDEPEANLNPMVMRLLVKILIELAREGQQIVIATHDYFLLKWFHLQTDAGQGDQVRYHTLHRDPASGEIAVNSTDDYLAIEPNPIDETFEGLINTEIDQSIGNLGR